MAELVGCTRSSHDAKIRGQAGPPKDPLRSLALGALTAGSRALSCGCCFDKRAVFVLEEEVSEACHTELVSDGRVRHPRKAYIRVYQKHGLLKRSHGRHTEPGKKAPRTSRSRRGPSSSPVCERPALPALTSSNYEYHNAELLRALQYLQ